MKTTIDIGSPTGAGYLRRRYFFGRGFCALDFVLETRCLAIAAWNSAMDGEPNAWGRFRASGNPVTGVSTLVSMLDFCMRLIVPCSGVALDTEC